MDPVADFGFHLDQLLSMAHQGSQVTIHTGLCRATGGPAVEQHGGNAHQIQPIRAGLQVLALFLGIMGIDVGHQPPVGPNRVGKILSIRVDIFASKKDMAGLNMPMTARTVDLVEQVLYAVNGIVDRKWFTEDLAVSVTKHDQMVLFGVIDRYTHQLRQVACLFE